MSMVGRTVMGIVLAGVLTASAGTLYVATNSPAPGAPYNSWGTAAHVIQDAVDTAQAGDTIIVTNGVYIAITVDKPLYLRSVNGPDATTIRGVSPTGSYMCCACLADGSLLEGFRVGGDYDFDPNHWHDVGGIACESTNVIITNCVIEGNAANMIGGVYGGTLYDCYIVSNKANHYAGAGGVKDGLLHHCVLDGNFGASGGGAAGCELNYCLIENNSSYYWGGGTYNCAAHNCVYRKNTVANYGGAAGYGSLYNCLLVGNYSAHGGGGTYCSDLYNCTVTGNTASNSLGGMYSGNAWNTIVYYNEPTGSEVWGCFSNCCIPPSLYNEGTYFTNAPCFISLDNPRLLANSPCINAGAPGGWLANGVDLDGRCRTNGVVDIGAYEYWADTRTGEVALAVSAEYDVTVPEYVIEFNGVMSGQVDSCQWDFGDGHVVPGGMFVNHAYASTGLYTVSATAWNNDSAVTDSVTIRICGPDVFVAQSGDDGQVGYDWAHAKATIQTAVDDAWPGARRVLVSNGVYNTGGRAYSLGLTNRVLLGKGLTLESVNGPNAAFIVGHAGYGGSNGVGAVRGVYMETGTCLLGFTVMKGHTLRTYVENCIWSPRYGSICTITDESPGSGGGVWSEDSSNIVSNCIFRKNSAFYHGGAVAYADVRDCWFYKNSVEGDGGGAYGCAVIDSRLYNNSAVHGGGASHCSLAGCVLSGNKANYGAAMDQSTVSNCLVKNNQGSSAVRVGTVVDSLIISNQASGIYGGSARNSILRGNTANDGAGAVYVVLENCTVVDNTAANRAGGVYSCHCYNSIIVSNHAPTNANWYGSCRFSYVCTTPLFPDASCISGDPCFVDYEAGDLRLMSNSPCIDAGMTNALFTDIDGIPRPLDGNNDGVTAWDIGAYEYVHPLADSDADSLSDSNECYVWHTQALNRDSDHDRLSDGDEVAAGTDPLNGDSCLSLSEVRTTDHGRLLTWQTVFGRGYWIQRCEDLRTGTWINVWDHPVYELDEYPEGTESFVDMNPPAEKPAIYRIKLDE